LATDDCGGCVDLCPICKARNRPDEGEACAHYLGTVRKRTLIWSRHAAEFAAAWASVEDAVFVADRNPHVVAAVLHSCSPLAPPGVRQVIEGGVFHHDPFFWVDDTDQSRVHMGKDRGQCGYSLYHRDPGFLARVIRRMNAAAWWITATLREPARAEDEASPPEQADRTAARETPDD